MVIANIYIAFILSHALFQVLYMYELTEYLTQPNEVSYTISSHLHVRHSTWREVEQLVQVHSASWSPDPIYNPNHLCFTRTSWTFCFALREGHSFQDGSSWRLKAASSLWFHQIFIFLPARCSASKLHSFHRVYMEPVPTEFKQESSQGREQVLREGLSASEVQQWESIFLGREGTFITDKILFCGIHRKCHFSKKEVALSN